MEKNLQKSKELLEEIVRLESEDDHDADLVSAKADEAMNLCPHDFKTSKPELDTDKVEVEECEDCGCHFYIQK